MVIFEGKMRKPAKGEIVIVVSKFNHTITDRLLDGALAKLRECGVSEENITVCRVPGAFELPIVAARFADMSGVSCVICLGAVIKGETPHDEHINRAVSLEIAKIATDTGTPVIFGLLTCNTVEQAIARSGGAAASHDKTGGKEAYIGNKGYEAAEAALEMINLMEQLPMPNDANPLGALSQMFQQAMIGGPGGDIYDNMFDFDDDDDEDWDDDDFDENAIPFPKKKSAKKSKAAKKSGKKKRGK